MNLGHLDIFHFGHTLSFVAFGLLFTLVVAAQIISTEIITQLSAKEAQF